jgi:hypothetical protein
LHRPMSHHGGFLLAHVSESTERIGWLPTPR